MKVDGTLSVSDRRVGGVPACPKRVWRKSRFTPEIQVGDRVVTRYQIDQRGLLLSLLGAPGDTRELAREQLINEAIQLSAAAEAEIEVTPEQLEGGMAEFAARGNLNIDQIMELLARAGIQPETFRDFIVAGLAWRSVVRARFSEDARESLPRSLITRTLAKTGTDGGTRVLVSEILLPTSNPETAIASRQRAAEISALQGEEAFAAAARRYSVASSRNNGGALNWVDIETLPPEIRSTVANLTPGQISRPVELENSVAVFLLRDVEVVQAGTEETILVDYALFTVDGGAGEAAKVAARVDVCDDLLRRRQGPARGTPCPRRRADRPTARRHPRRCCRNGRKRNLDRPHARRERHRPYAVRASARGREHRRSGNRR